MSTYQNTDVVVGDEADDFESNTGEGMISSSSLLSSKKQNRRKSALLLAATAFCGVSGVGFVSWNSNNNNKITHDEQQQLAARIGTGEDVDVALLGHDHDDPVDACDDEINYDEDGCFKLSFCDDTFYQNYVQCHNENRAFNVIDFDLYPHGPQQVCPLKDSLTQYLFGEDYVVGKCYDAHCYQDSDHSNTDIDCAYLSPNGDIQNIVKLECGTLYSEGTCRVCNVEI
mmetsp:Transcript_5272/g.6098  ORF Transcript_5272/g.6098 Transcript_5272/m.6098 type:complete len:228 (+) Transcript_5272:65-748(+)